MTTSVIVSGYIHNPEFNISTVIDDLDSTIRDIFNQYYGIVNLKCTTEIRKTYETKCITIEMYEYDIDIMIKELNENNFKLIYSIDPFAKFVINSEDYQGMIRNIDNIVAHLQNNIDKRYQNY